jgi:predicted phage terminase large subunit-like protein
MSDRSVFERLARQPVAERERLIASLTHDQRRALLFDWSVWRRPKQATPLGDWRVWLILAGRGFGKTRTGAEFIREQVDRGQYGRIALVGATAADVRDTMIEGESGLLAVFPPEHRPRYEPSKRRITFHNGSTAVAFSADEPDRLRGPNHDLAWADELAAWRYDDAWDQLMLGLRLGDHPRVVVTTTPRPVPIIRRLARSDDGTVHVTTGSTYENAGNLAADFIAEMKRRYEGTRLGRQELEAQILDDVEGALWERDLIDAHRVTDTPPLRRIVVAIDPAVTSGEDADETGIVVAGVAQNGDAYILDDRTMRASPNDWASAAVAAYHRHRADLIVAEANQGGDLVENVLKAVDPRVPVRLVRASRGKRTRAEPVAALYEQGRAHHAGFFPDLEDQLCSWVPDVGSSPDRLDALVWALTELVIDRARAAPVVVPASLEQASPWRI